MGVPGRQGSCDASHSPAYLPSLSWVHQSKLRGTGWYTLGNVKRAVILGVVLSLAGLGPVPLSACALLSSRLAECATPATMSHCSHMGMHADSGTTASAAPDRSCCKLSNAPAPARQQNSPQITLLPPSHIELLHATQEPSVILRTLPFEIAINPSPPPSQSLFCTFLI